LESLYCYYFGEKPGLYGKELAAFRSPRGRENEAAVTHSFYDSLRELHQKYESRKEEIRSLLEETGALMHEAVLFLKKANRLTRYVTARQRQETGMRYHPSFFDSRLKGRDLLPLMPNKILDHGEFPPELADPGGRELKLGELRMLRLMDILKKNLLALDLLEMRCRELLLSINKAQEAFRHEYALIRRRVYPYSFFSVLYKHFRRLRGFSYFSHRDLKELAVLGELTGHILKIADSPIL
jgi:hypothetical protein